MRSVVANLVRSCTIGCAAGVATIVVSGPVLADVAPPWISESVTGYAAAAVWMIAGLYVAKSAQPVIAPVLFCFGAATAWLLARGIVHSTSAYYGLFPFAVACLGGACAWLFQQRHATRGRAIAMLLPLAVVVITFAIALFRAPLGVTRSVTTADSVTRDLPVVAIGVGAPNEWYVWADRNVELAPSADRTIYIELDPGSGSGRFSVVEVGVAAEIRAACDAFHAQAAALAESEIASGAVPRFMRALPVRYRTCEHGRVWIARD